MEYTILSHFDIRPGTLTLWSAVRAPGTEWKADERPLTCVHENYHRNFDATDPRPGRGRWIGTIFEMDAPFDARSVRDLVWAWHARHEGLRTTVAPTESGIGRLTCAALDVDIVHERVSEVSASAELNDYLRDTLEERLSPLVWPHVVIATVEHRDTHNFTVLVGADHSVMDAYSQVLIVTELRALYRALLDGTSLPHSDTFASPADYALVERQAAAALTTECAPTEVWRNFLSASEGRFPRFAPPIAAVEDTAGQPQTSVSRWLLTDAEIGATEEAASALGHRPTTAVFAALALASCRLSGTAEFRTIMPVATRPHKCWAESMGWFVNIVPLAIPVPGGANYRDALVATDGALRAAKPATLAPADRIFELLEVRDRPRFAVSYVDIRRLPDNEIIAGLRGRALRADSYSTDEVYFWVVRAAEGLNISARFPAGYSAAVLQRFIDEFTAILREFGEAATAELAPALMVVASQGAA
ncbi:condensation domain-containing protein [Nocardia sp. NPDC051570]|uniref:condensation domain-containing protein n=1 Tax=Nocardia sp. NPDC051570 TaxID=3364324 RepID=UPI00378CAEBF